MPLHIFISSVECPSVILLIKFKLLCFVTEHNIDLPRQEQHTESCEIFLNELKEPSYCFHLLCLFFGTPIQYKQAHFLSQKTDE